MEILKMLQKQELFAQVRCALWAGLIKPGGVWLLAGLLICASVQAQAEFDPKEVIWPDPSSSGYTVDNNWLGLSLPLTVHKDLPERTTLRLAGRIDERYQLANLIADEAGNYSSYPQKKVILVHRKTGEVKPTPYVGTIECLVDGNLAIVIGRGKDKPLHLYGKFGETLQEWEEGTYGTPSFTHLEKYSCTLQGGEPTRYRNSNPSAIGRRLRPEHGLLQIRPGAPRPANAKDVPPEVQTLMQKPFMQNMQIAAATAQWYLIKPDGQEVWIPTNPGEDMQTLDYIPYLGAYFASPWRRQMLSDEMRALPNFARLIYPDGHVERLDVPDAMRQKGIGLKAIYTKAGVIWEVIFGHHYPGGRTPYDGPLKEGFYLEQKDKKVLVKLPDLEQSTSPLDGCTLNLKSEMTRLSGHSVFSYRHVNICTKE
jgi:hypothetical protein